ncbi:MAG: hypothetical protein KGH63_00130 [Candidatus Micrarchaeota archaeon]|nr:hypothetical protein [Candidatus Micrarchaeota archaeon]
MFELLLWLLLCALAGFCAKLVDERVDSALPIPAITAALLALLYGAAAGILATSTPLSSLFIALAVSALLANKLDHPLHLLGLLAFTAVLLARPISSFDVWLFSLFLALGLLDELKLRLLRPLAVLNEQRLWVPAGCLALALWDATSPALNWSNLPATFSSLSEHGLLFLLAIVCFDAAYRLAGAMAQKAFKRPSVRMASKRRRR